MFLCSLVIFIQTSVALLLFLYNALQCNMITQKTILVSHSVVLKLTMILCMHLISNFFFFFLLLSSTFEVLPYIAVTVTVILTAECTLRWRICFAQFSLQSSENIVGNIYPPLLIKGTKTQDKLKLLPIGRNVRDFIFDI